MQHKGKTKKKKQFVNLDKEEQKMRRPKREPKVKYRHQQAWLEEE